jgi:uncharacterized protein YcbK (DUF882 family)
LLADGKYFKVKELACHDGTPYPDFYAGRLVELMSLLDKIREAHGGPVQVVSGYRSPAYNARLAEDSQAHQVASGSQHIQGRAADLRPVHGTVQDFYQEIMALHRAGKLPELGGIGLYPESNWVHVDTFHAEDGHTRQWRGR